MSVRRFFHGDLRLRLEAFSLPSADLLAGALDAGGALAPAFAERVAALQGRDVAPPTAAAVAAAAVGALASPPLLDVLDGGDCLRAVCLCCYRARSRRAAAAAAAALAAFMRYYDHASYLGSRAFERAVARASADVEPGDLADIAADLDPLLSAAERRAAVPGQICVAAPACRPGVLWVYSTPGARRALRHLARTIAGTSVAVAGPAEAPRHRGRMYTVRVPDVGAALRVLGGWADSLLARAK
jgi:hypothetical protein